MIIVLLLCEQVKKQAFNRVLKCDVIKFSFFAFQHFNDNISVLEHDEKPSHTKFDMNWFMVAQDMAASIPKMSPIEISVNWPGLVHNCLEPDQFTLISMGLIRYSCGHILGPHEPIPTQIGLWMFFIMLH